MRWFLLLAPWSAHAAEPCRVASAVVVEVHSFTTGWTYDLESQLGSYSIGPSATRFQLTCQDEGQAVLAMVNREKKGWAVLGRRPDPSVVGIWPGAWSEAIAAKVPEGSTVVLRTDHDEHGAGARYAARWAQPWTAG